MTQEEKELLLKDLCARLPYNVIVDPIDCGKAILIGIKDRKLLLFDTVHKKEYDKSWDIEYVKPYLRPMSSMTEEEYTNLWISCTWLWFDNDLGTVIHGDYKCYDWLNAHHFDYRGLIEKGLALEAPKGMYK